MRTISGFAIVRRCCTSAIVVPIKSERRLTRRILHTNFYFKAISTRRRAGFAGEASGGFPMTSYHAHTLGPAGSAGAVSSYFAAAAGSPPATHVSTTGLTGLGPPYDQHIASDFLARGPLLPGRKVYLIVLNYCLPAGLLHVWPLASFRICADGGCNRLYDELPSMVPPPPTEIAALEGLAEEDTAAATAIRPATPAAGPAQGMGPRTTAPVAETNSIGGVAVNVASSSAFESDRHSSNHDRGSNLCNNQNGYGPYLSQGGIAAGLEVHEDVFASLRLAYLPDVVLGDLDSLRPDVRQYYLQHGVPFMDMSYDQDTNDLVKAISLVEERYIQCDPDRSSDHHQILVLGALGGRMDHTLANLNVLHMYPHLNITLWGDGNLVRLVRPGKVLITPDERFEGPTCGLIPIAGPVTATSSGLRWNVSSTQLRVGGLVSSSNLLTGSPVEVACDGPLLWSTELHEEPRPDLWMLWARTAAAVAAVRKREQQQQQQQKGGASGVTPMAVLS